MHFTFHFQFLVSISLTNLSHASPFSSGMELPASRTCSRTHAPLILSIILEPMFETPVLASELKTENLNLSSLPRQIPNQLPQRPANRQHLTQIICREIRSRDRCALTLPADLNHSHNFPFVQNRRTHDFLDRFSSRRRCLHSFKHRRMPYRRKIIIDFRPALSRRPRRQRRIAGQRHKPYVLQCCWR